MPVLGVHAPVTARQQIELAINAVMRVRHPAGALGDQRFGGMKAGQVRGTASLIGKMHNVQ